MPTTSNDGPNLPGPYGVDPDYKKRLGFLPPMRGPMYAGDNLTGLPTGTGVPRPVYAFPPNYERDANRIGLMTRGEIIHLQDRLQAAGALTGTINPGDPAQTVAAYKKAMLAANYEVMDVEDYLDWKGGMSSRGGGGSGGGGGGGGGSSYSSTSISNSSMVSRSVNLTGRGTAEGILRSALQQQLGRAPSNDEVRQFKRALNVKERKNPTITKSTSSTTTTTSGSSKGSSSSTTSNTSGTSKSVTKQSDIDPQEEALDFATSTPGLRRERRRYQGAQFYDVLSDMLGM